MYHLFYAGHMLFGGIGYLMSAVGVVNAVRKNEERHLSNMYFAKQASYWEGHEEAWKEAYRRGEENMLTVCQSLAMESVDIVGMDPNTQQLFMQVVSQWPQYALSQSSQSDSNPVS